MSHEPGLDFFRREFREESAEHLHALDEGLLALESAMKAGTGCPSDVLEEMFRATHTMKGLSAMFELHSVRDLAHDLESVFDRLRKETIEPDATLVDVLFDAVDALREAVDHMDDESYLGTRDAVHRSLAALVRAEDQTSGRSDRGDEQLSEYAAKRVLEAAAEGLSAYELRLRWGIELRLGAYSITDVESMVGRCELLEVRALVDQLPELAAIDPATADVEFSVLLLSDHDSAEIADAIGMDVGRVRLVERSQSPKKVEAAPATSTRLPARGLTTSSTGFVRVDISRLNDLVNLTGELVAARSKLSGVQLAVQQLLGKNETSLALASSVKDVGILISGLQERVMQLRMVPIEHLFSKLPRVVRDIGRSTGKDIEFSSVGGDVEIDKRLIEQIEDPLIHMVRNACDHGIESPEERVAAGKPGRGSVVVRALQDGSNIVIEVYDDGSGLDMERIRERAMRDGRELPENPSSEELAEVLMAAGFTTASIVTDVSGRGVGLDVVRRRIMDLGGHVEVDSKLGEGTTFRLRTPMTMAISSALLVNTAGQTLAVPLSFVTEVLRVQAGDIRGVKRAPVLDLRGETLPLIELRDVLNLTGVEQSRRGRRFVVVVFAAGYRVGLLVDSFIGQQDLVVKSVDESMGRIAGLSGATILGDGRIVPIVNPEAIARLARSQGDSPVSQVIGGEER